MGLWNEQIRNEFAAQQHMRPELLKDRRTGRSTRIALITLARCYELRGEWLEIRDHYDTPSSNLLLFDTLFTMVKQLGFQGFEFNRLEMKLRLTL